MEANHIYQYSLLNALMAGACEEGITAAEFSRRGNQGLGTFARMDGELVSLDGTVYQLQEGGAVRVAGADARIPFAVGTQFEAQTTLDDVELADKGGIGEVLRRHDARAANLFVSYRIEGRFEYLKCRTVRGQEYDGQPLSELGDKQSVSEYRDVRGTIVGLRSPKIFQGFSVAGEHSHFIDEERRFGGHVLEVRASGVRVGVATASHIHMQLPTSDEFERAELATNDDAIKKVEG